MVSWAHNVAPKGYYIAIVSTIAEGNSNHHLELQAGFDRLGKIEEQFMGPPIPIYEPLESGSDDNIFISRSYDATSHFETTTGKKRRGRGVSMMMFADTAAQMISAISTEEPRVTSWWLRVCVKVRTWSPKSRQYYEYSRNINCVLFCITMHV
jgi:hypothetical protein